MGLIVEARAGYNVRERVRFLDLPKEVRAARQSPAHLVVTPDRELEDVLLDMNFLRSFQRRGQVTYYTPADRLTSGAEAEARQAVGDLRQFAHDRLSGQRLDFPLSRIIADRGVDGEGKALTYMFLLRSFWADRLAQGNRVLEKFYFLSSYRPEVIDEENIPLDHRFSWGMQDLLQGRGIATIFFSAPDSAFCLVRTEKGNYLPVPTKKYPSDLFSDRLRRYDAAMRAVSFV